MTLRSPIRWIRHKALVAPLVVALLAATPGCHAQQQQNPLTMNGGSLLAMAGENCVALAVDKRFGSGPQLVNISPRRVWAPNSRLLVAFSGLEGDVVSLSEELRAELVAKRHRALGFVLGSGVTETESEKHHRIISPPALACLVSHVLYQKRGYYVEPLVVGLRETTETTTTTATATTATTTTTTTTTMTPFLCAMDMIGAQSVSQSFVCSGAASTSLYGIAEALWRPGMNPDELLECCGRVFQSALERDCLSGYGILVYLITKNGIAEYDLASRND